MALFLRWTAGYFRWMAHITVAVAEVAHCAVAEYLLENQPLAKRPCRLRPIPIKVEPPITITLSSDEEEEKYSSIY